MKSGFSDALDFALRRFGMRSSFAVGLVQCPAIRVFHILKNRDFNVEYCEEHLKYDFIYIPRAKVGRKTIIETLTKLHFGGIIVFVVDAGSKVDSELYFLQSEATHRISVLKHEYAPKKLLVTIVSKGELIDELK